MLYQGYWLLLNGHKFWAKNWTGKNAHKFGTWIQLLTNLTVIFITMQYPYLTVFDVWSRQLTIYILFTKLVDVTLVKEYVLCNSYFELKQHFWHLDTCALFNRNYITKQFFKLKCNLKAISLYYWQSCFLCW